MLGIAAFAALALLGTEPDRLVRRHRRPAPAARARLGPTPWSAIGWRRDRRRHRVDRVVAVAVGRRVVTVLPDLGMDVQEDLTSLDRSGEATAVHPVGRRHPAPADPRWRGRPRGASSTIRSTAGSRSGRSAGPGRSAPGRARTSRSPWRAAPSHVDAVEIDPELAAIGRDFHPERSTTTRGSPSTSTTGARSSTRRPSEYDLDRLRPDRLADPGQLDRRCPPRVVPVHRAVVRRGQGPPGAGRRCSSCTTCTASRGSSPSWTRCSATVFGDDRMVRLVGRVEAMLAAGPAVDGAGRRTASRRSRGRRARASASRRRQHATDDWPFLYLRTRDDRAVLPRGARVHPGLRASSPSWPRLG